MTESKTCAVVKTALWTGIPFLIGFLGLIPPLNEFVDKYITSKLSPIIGLPLFAGALVLIVAHRYRRSLQECSRR